MLMLTVTSGIHYLFILLKPTIPDEKIEKITGLRTW